MRTKEELKKHLDCINQNLEGLTAKKLEVEKQLEEVEKSEFDFEELMPVGSVWLGVLEMMSQIWKGRPNYQALTTQAKFAKSFYHAHQIVKAAQYYQKSGAHGDEVESYGNLISALKAAEQDGVLQNLE